MKAPFIKNFFRNIKNLLGGIGHYVQSKATQQGYAQPTGQGSKGQYSSSWWKRLYRVKTRSEVGLLNRHVLKFQGSFSPIRRFKTTRTEFNMRFKIKKSNREALMKLYNKFIKKTVNLFDRVKQLKVVAKLAGTKVETGRSKGGGGKSAIPNVSLTNREVAFIRLQEITRWKKVTMRRVRKGRAVKSPTKKYIKALGNL